MDRTAATTVGVALTAISLFVAGRAYLSPSAQPEYVNLPSEPARLDLHDVFLKPVPETASDQIIATRFPFLSVSQPEENGPQLISPETATPTLAIPQSPVIELPSANATPSPIECAPATVAPPTRSPMAPKTNFATGRPTGVNAAPAVIAPSTTESIVLPQSAPPTQSPPLTESVPSIQSVALPESVPLPQASAGKPATPLRPATLAAAVERADRMTVEAIALGRRGAIFSARSRFLLALRQIVSAQDELNSTTKHTQAFQEAIKAMDESHDFETHYAASTEPVDVERIVIGHRTVVLKEEDLSNITPTTARNRYQIFAVEQLTTALGGEQAGSLPMFGLGRLNTATGKSNADGDAFGSSDALVWYHAALMTDSNNFPAAHELGSLYAKRGEWERARIVLQRAVGVYPHPTTWGNLAVVHEKLGEHEWAVAARSRAGTNVAKTPPVELPSVEWVDASTFAKTTGPNESYFPKQTTPPAAAPATSETEPRSASKPKSTKSWLPWGTSQRR